MNNANASLLPNEVTALVHHIELNRAGWWDKGVHRLVLACVWLSEHSSDIDSIQMMLKRDFRLQLSKGKVTAALSALQKQDLLVVLRDGHYRIPDEKRVAFERDIAAAEGVANGARDFFFGLVEKCW